MAAEVEEEAVGPNGWGGAWLVTPPHPVGLSEQSIFRVLGLRAQRNYNPIMTLSIT